MGTEQHTKLDSGSTTYSFDTIYPQEYDVTYSKNMYTFITLLGASANQVSTIHKNDIVNHEFFGPAETYYDTLGNLLGGHGNLRFSGDSLYVNSSGYKNGDEDFYSFKGKRNW